MLCKGKSVDVNPVDGYGNTPLDNARMMGRTAIAALLERAGGKSGADESLCSQSNAAKEWVQRNARAQRQQHLDEVLAKLPEQEQVTRAAAAVQCQAEFVQVHPKLARSTHGTMRVQLT